MVSRLPTELIPVERHARSRQANRVGDLSRVSIPASADATTVSGRRSRCVSDCSRVRGRPSRRPLDQRTAPHDELAVPIRLPGLELTACDRPAKRRLRERHQGDRVGEEHQPIVLSVGVVVVSDASPREPRRQRRSGAPAGACASSIGTCRPGPARRSAVVAPGLLHHPASPSTVSSTLDRAVKQDDPACPPGPCSSGA